MVANVCARPLQHEKAFYDLRCYFHVIALLLILEAFLFVYILR